MMPASSMYYKLKTFSTEASKHKGLLQDLAKVGKLQTYGWPRLTFGCAHKQEGSTVQCLYHLAKPTHWNLLKDCVILDSHWSCKRL